METTNKVEWKCEDCGKPLEPEDVCFDDAHDDEADDMLCYDCFLDRQSCPCGGGDHPERCVYVQDVCGRRVGCSLCKFWMPKIRSDAVD